MPKIKVIDPKGLRLSAKKNIQTGEVFDQPKGPLLDAWLRFKQVEIVAEPSAEAGKEKAEKSDKTPVPAPKK